MHRLAAVLVVTALLAGSGCSRSEPADDGVDGFCESFARFQGIQSALSWAPAYDPQLVLPALAAIEPPEQLRSYWPSWHEQWRTYYHDSIGIARHGGPRFWHRPVVRPDPGPVEDFWKLTCMRDRGYQKTELVSADDPALPPFLDPPEVGEIRVVEYGFTARSWTEPGGHPEHHAVAVGIIVENTTDQVAVEVKVEITPVNHSGDTMRTGSEPLLIPALLPGEQFGVGERLITDEPEVAELRITIGSPERWWPTDHEVVRFARVSGEEITTEVRSPEGPGMGETYRLHYIAHSEYSSQSPGHFAHAILRDAEGTIVGGGNGLTRRLQPGRNPRTMGINGWGAFEPDSDVDHSRTEVYIS